MAAEKAAGGGESRRQFIFEPKADYAFRLISKLSAKKFWSRTKLGAPEVLLWAVKRIPLYAHSKTRHVFEFCSAGKLGGSWSFALGHKTDCALRLISNFSAKKFWCRTKLGAPEVLLWGIKRIPFFGGSQNFSAKKFWCRTKL